MLTERVQRSTIYRLLENRKKKLIHAIVLSRLGASVFELLSSALRDEQRTRLKRFLADICLALSYTIASNELAGQSWRPDADGGKKTP